MEYYTVGDVWIDMMERVTSTTLDTFALALKCPAPDMDTPEMAGFKQEEEEDSLGGAGEKENSVKAEEREDSVKNMSEDGQSQRGSGTPMRIGDGSDDDDMVEVKWVPLPKAPILDEEDDLEVVEDSFRLPESR
ncbi:hypothetical protein JCM5353_001137, partial [Sporobolomyces roseus]